MMSHFGYNEATGAKFLPKTKEEALAEGYRWYESEQADHATTIAAENLPQKITETPETIVSEIIECMECKRGYKIGQLEYTLIKKMGIPVPHSCPSCRQNARFARLNPPRLWKRECAKCQKEISTAFAPEREETVYCADCYQQEFV
jgi:CxxC-x17-CxxC domain-containing protein